MADRLGAVLRRLVPRGPLDLAWQFALIAAAYTGWRYARGAVDGGYGESVAHARDLIDVERFFGTFVEVDVQRWSVDSGWPSELARWWYANVHFKGSCAAVLAVYFLRNESFRFLRNAVIIAFAISFLGYWLYPTAPPRFIAELGLDTSSAVTGQSSGAASAGQDALFNPFAAVPSMHVGLSAMFGFTLAMLVRPWPVRALLSAYPLMMLFVVVATGNHFWIDGLFGVMTSALALGVALWLGRQRADWAFMGPSGAGTPENLLTRLQGAAPAPATVTAPAGGP